MKEEINLLKHVYEKDVLVQIPGDLLYALMQVLNQVKENETQQVFVHSYSLDAKEVRDENNVLQNVEQTQIGYDTAQAFFNQSPLLGTSLTGAAAHDLLMLLQGIHLDNINAGIAKEVGTFEVVKDGL